jgi:hypothetical protein
VKHLSVSLKQMQARFARSLSDARAQEDDPTAGQVFIVPGPDIERMGKRDGVTNVIRFRRGAIGVFVYEDNLTSYALHHQGVGGGGAHETTSDDTDLHP